MVILYQDMFVNTRKEQMNVSPPVNIVGVTIGEKIKSLRKARGWSQGELAEKLGVKPQNISRYEKGHVQPRESTLALFAEVFELPLSELTNVAAPLAVSDVDPELAEYVRAIPSLDPKDQEAVKCVLRALVTAKKAQDLFAS